MIEYLKVLFNYRELIKNFVKRDLKVRYKNSILGFFWSLLSPLLMMIILTLAFSVILRIKVDNYPVFLLCAILPWSFHSSSLTFSAHSIIYNDPLLNKVYFPREIFPISSVISNLVNFFFALSVLFLFLAVFKIKIGLAILMLPVIIAIQSIFILGLSLLVSWSTVFFRDLEHILEVFLSFWFYVTPVIYPTSMVPDRFIHYYFLNPMVGIIKSYRNVLMYNHLPALNEILYPIIVSIVLFYVGYITFKKYEFYLVERI